MTFNMFDRLRIPDFIPELGFRPENYPNSEQVGLI